MKSTPTLALIALAIFCLVARSPAAALGQPPLLEAPAEMAAADQVVFFDDFSGAELDRTKWNVRTTGTIHNNEQQNYVDSAETHYLVHDERAAGAKHGALVLHPRFQPGSKTPEGRDVDFVSCRLNTKAKVEITYGTLAARIKLPQGEGIWPAFWALGTEGWPATGEIDIMEYVGETDWIGVALHGPGYSGETPLVNKFFFPPGEAATGWHTYSVDWSPDTMLFRVDDRLIYRVTRPMVERYGEWAFDTPKFLLLNVAVGGAYPEKTSGVKQPYPGLPAETVAMIRANRVKMLVDWVRVTQPSEPSKLE